MCSPALQEGWQPPAAECAALIRPFQGRATKRLLLPLFAVAVQSLSGQDVPRLQARADSLVREWRRDRKSTRLNSSHSQISYAVFCLKKKKKTQKSTYYIHKKTHIDRAHENHDHTI